MSTAFQEILLQRGIISPDQLHIALIEQQKTNSFLGEILIDLEFASPKIIGELSSSITGYTFIDLDPLRINTELLFELGKEFWEQHGSIPFKIDKHLHIAMIDPENVVTQDILKKQTKKFLRDDQNWIFYYTHKQSFHRALQQLAQPQIQASDASFDALFSGLLDEAVSKEASDIHFMPLKQMVLVKLRIHGELTINQHIEWSVFDKICVRFKILSKLDIAERRKPQSGGCIINIHNQPTDCRVSLHPCLWGESLVVRILPTNRKVLSLERLGFERAQIQTMKKIMQRTSGLFLVCGATGSGKTTTLQALLHECDFTQKNIMTLEQPIEYRINGIRQTEIQENGVITFADGVRSMMRHDPDIILIGEIRDEDTAKMALRASMTGHLVLATLHASCPYVAPARLIDLGLSPNLLSGQILAVLCQKLIRTPNGRKAEGELVVFTEQMHRKISTQGKIDRSC